MGGRGTAWMLAIGLCMAALLVAPAAALAGTTYRSLDWPGCGGGFNSGGADTAGRTYVPCGDPSTIGIYDAAGDLVRSVPLDRFVTDVEPVGDGSILYLAGYAVPQRLVRQPSGDYALDATWKPDKYPFEGGSYPAAGLFVDSDAAGNVYYADGYWASGRHTVVQYDPAGKFVTRFGAYNAGPKDANGKNLGSWAHGDNYWALGGIAVSPDGRRALTTEAGNNRVQIWTRGEDETLFTTNTSVGGTQANNPTREGFCDFAGWIGKFAAPYDVSLDAAGNVYVINTTCKQVLRFNPEMTALTANLEVRMPDGSDVRPHGFAVAADGMIYVGQNRRVWIPTESAADTPAVPVRPNTQPPGGSDSQGAGGSTGSGSSGQAPVAPAVANAAPSAGASARAFAGSFVLRAPVTRRLPTRQIIYGTTRCSATCSVVVRVRAGQRVLGTYRSSRWSGAVKHVAIAIPRRRAGMGLTISITATSATGEAVTRVRAYRIAA